MVQLRLYKQSGEVKVVEAESDAQVTFRDNGKDDNGDYFYAVAPNLQNAFALLTEGIKTIQVGLRATAASLDSVLESLALNELIVGVSGGFDEKKPTKLVE